MTTQALASRTIGDALPEARRKTWAAMANLPSKRRYTAVRTKIRLGCELENRVLSCRPTCETFVSIGMLNSRRVACQRVANSRKFASWDGEHNRNLPPAALAWACSDFVPAKTGRPPSHSDIPIKTSSQVWLG